MPQESCSAYLTVSPILNSSNFMSCFDDGVEVLDERSGSTIAKDGARVDSDETQFRYLYVSGFSKLPVPIRPRSRIGFSCRPGQPQKKVHAF
jgi:hypothetical protein